MGERRGPGSTTLPYNSEELMGILRNVLGTIAGRLLNETLFPRQWCLSEAVSVFVRTRNMRPRRIGIGCWASLIVLLLKSLGP